MERNWIAIGILAELDFVGDFALIAATFQSQAASKRETAIGRF